MATACPHRAARAARDRRRRGRAEENGPRRERGQVAPEACVARAKRGAFGGVAMRALRPLRNPRKAFVPRPVGVCSVVGQLRLLIDGKR